MQKFKKPVSILLVFMMIVSLFAIVPVTASAAVGDFVQEKDYLTFTAEEAGSSVTLNVSTGSNLKYNLNGAGWESYSKGTQITLANVGDYVRFCGNNTTFDEYNHHVSIGGKVACSGNVMSLRLDDNGKSQGLSYDCFDNMFMDCTGLTAAPELPETNLAESCYFSMFYGCTSLTTAPALPATALADYCYYGMFAGCTSLTTAPVLPATMLAESCYDTMFYGCTSLTTAPALPVTMLAEGCYFGMFAGCESLTTAPELPATSLAQYCYNAMFSGCTSLTTAPALPATSLAEGCYSEMFSGCTSLTTAPALPATTLAEGCYSAMFYGCSSIKLSETQTAEYSIPYSVPSGGNGTTADYALDAMFAGTGGTFTGTPEINKTYYMYREVPKYTVTWKNWDGTVLETDENVAEGATPTYDGTAPEKASDKYYDYTFSGWTPAVAPVSADVTYTAQFTSEARTFMVFVKKLTGGTINVYDVSGETTVAQLKDILASQTGAPASAQRLIFAGKQLDDAKTLAEYNIQKESTLHLIIRGYTVTWKNWNGDVLETDTGVVEGATPSYDGEPPVRPEDANNTYTFAAWDDGKTTYVIGVDDLPPVTGDVTYTAVYTGETKPLFAGHSVTLGGDIGVNFFIDGNVAGVANAQTAVVKFAWDGGNYIEEVNLKELTPNDKGLYKVTINVVAAQMAHRIEAVAYINGEMIYTADLYSVQEYAEAVYAEPEKYDPEKPAQLKALAEALLHYGSEAQTVFDSYLYSHPDRADSNLDSAADYSAVTADAVAAAINGDTSNLDAVAGYLGAKFYTSSLLYLSQNTLRLYFTPNDDSFDPAWFDDVRSDCYYYVQKEDIPAAELDDQQSFTVGNGTFTYSALDYVKAVISSPNMTEEQKNLAKSLFCYNQAANDYFD